MFLDMDKVSHLVSEQFISVRRHPTLPLRIFNYTPKCQYKWNWTLETIACRGLILDDNDNVVSRPFVKFFTPEQYKDLRNSVCHLFGVKYKNMYDGNFSVHSKLDGSLGVGYTYKGHQGVATRGSFTSEQAIRATDILNHKHDFILNSGVTYLFEIIYPDNRIVIDYYGMDDIILLAVLDNETQKSIDIWETPWKGSRAERIFKFSSDENGVQQALTETEGEGEGYVIHFPETNIRVKVKFEEYKRLHSILTNVTPRSIWKMLVQGEDVSVLVTLVPDEFYNWIKTVERELRIQYDEIEEAAISLLQEHSNLTSRKELALRIKGHELATTVFQMLDNKDYSWSIWRNLKPVQEPSK